MGREFVPMFDDWAETYDDTVKGEDLEYKEVFHDYEDILDAVIRVTEGNVLEFGVGTGNLTEKLLAAGHTVFGVEPSKGMREKTREKFPEVRVEDGDFIHFPDFADTLHTVVSSYAFHHLTDEEKDIAVEKYSRLLPVGGKIVFADTLFESETHKQEILNDVKYQGFLNLYEDLKTEYYPYKSTMAKIFEKHGFETEFTALNRYVWLMVAVKT